MTRGQFRPRTKRKPAPDLKRLEASRAIQAPPAEVTQDDQTPRKRRDDPPPNDEDE